MRQESRNELNRLQEEADQLAAIGDWGARSEAVNRRLLELDASRTKTYTRLAKCLREKGEREAAEALYRRVLEIDPSNGIASNALRRLTGERQAAGDLHDEAEKRAAARPGMVRAVTEPEIELLLEACRAIPVPEGDYVQNDYVTNVLLTVLDLRMHNVAVTNSIRHYWDNRWDEIRTLESLDGLLQRFPDDTDGNLQAAQYLWGNNHWTRIEWLRGFVRFLSDNALTTQEALRRWAHSSDFSRDFEGRVKHLGIAAFKWLAMRLGVDTVKPDVHLHNFVEGVVGHRVTDAELVGALEEVARRLGRTARQLDWGLWEFQRGAPGAV